MEKHTGLNRKWWQRKWFKALITIAATLVNPALGAVVGGLIAGGILKRGLDTSGMDIEEPTQAELLEAQTNLQQFAIPTVNTITNELNLLLVSSLSITKTINKLNNLLLQIAILQGYVEKSLTNTNDKISFMVASVIEPLLAKMNTLVTDVIDKNNIQKNVEKESVSITVSDYSNVLTFSLDWKNETVIKTYEKLVEVTSSTTDTVISPSLDNPLLSDTIIEINEQQKQPKIGTIFVTGLVIFKGLLWLAKKSDNKTAKEKGLKGKKICNDRFKCNGINKKTGNTKKGFSRKKGGAVIKAVKGLDANGKLKKGFRWHNKKPLKVKTGLNAQKPKIFVL